MKTTTTMINTILEEKYNYVHKTGKCPTKIYLGHSSYRDLKRSMEEVGYCHNTNTRDNRPEISGMEVYLVDADYYLDMS